MEAHPLLSETNATGHAWTVRYSWAVPEGSQHPRQTTATHPTETGAIDQAVSRLDGQDPTAPLRIIRAEISGPDGRFRPIEYAP